MKLKIVGGGLLAVLLALAIGSLAWGWIIMLIAGICGWNIPFLPTSVALGAGVTLLLSSVSK